MDASYSDSLVEALGWFAAYFVLESLTRGSLVLLAAGAICRFAKRLGPADRHRIWWFSLIVTLLLICASAPNRASVKPVFTADPFHSSSAPPRHASPPAPVFVPVAEGEAFPAVKNRAEPSSRAAFGLHLSRFQTQFIGMAWFAGTLFLLARLGCGWRSLNQLQRSATSMTGPPWQSLQSELMDNLGIRRPVALFCSSRIQVPLTFGTRQPSILLPESSNGWHEERCRAVLLHELSHIRRWDCLVQNLASILGALLWFHPLVWLAKARMRTEREFACDASVLDHGLKPSEYARQLLDLAGPAPRHTPAGAVAMAHPALISRRIQAILDPSHLRHPSRPLIAGGAAAALFLGGALLPQPFALATTAPPAPMTVPSTTTRDPQPRSPESAQILLYQQAVQRHEQTVRTLTATLKQLQLRLPSQDQSQAVDLRPLSDSDRIERLGRLRMDIVSRSAVARATRDRLKSLPPDELLATVTQSYPDDALVQQAYQFFTAADLAWRSSQARHGEDSPEARQALQHKELSDRQLNDRVQGLLHALNLQVELAREELAQLDQELKRALNQSSDLTEPWQEYFLTKRRLENEKLIVDILNRKISRAQFLAEEVRSAPDTNSLPAP